MSDGSGTAILKNTYDEYGKPGATNGGRFMYTGQMYVPEAAAYWYKARMYEPALGRFLQTDPIGYDGGMNLYAYVGNDPLNATDPTGLVQNQYLATFPDSTTCNFYADESGVPTNVSCSGGSTNGYLQSINNYVANYGLPGDIIVTAERLGVEASFFPTSPRPDPSWMFHDPILASEPNSALHWYVNSFAAGAAYQENRVRTAVRRCLAGGGNVQWPQVARDAIRGSIQSVIGRNLLGRLFKGISTGGRGQLISAVGGAVRGASGSVFSQACGD